MRRLRAASLFALVAAASACSGDDTSSPSSISLSGRVVDYFSGVALPAVGLTIDSTDVSVGSEADGSYTFPDLPKSSTITVLGQFSNYRGTRSPRIALGRAHVERDLALVSNADAARQYVQASVTAIADSGALYVTLAAPSGAPRVGIPLADITLTNESRPLGVGPYVFGAAGDLDPTLTTTASFGGRSRIAFLNVPSGVHTLTLTLPGSTTLTLPVRISYDVVTLAER